jgi:hypothetical protein
VDKVPLANNEFRRRKSDFFKPFFADGAVVNIWCLFSTTVLLQPKIE